MTAIRRANPWAVLALALLVLVLDQWTKVLAMQHLASPAHPMVVIGDGTRPVEALFAERGVAAATVRAAAAKRHLWAHEKASGLQIEQRLDSSEAPRQLLALRGTGFPAPRRMRVHVGDEQRTLGELIEEQWRVPTGVARALLKDEVHIATRAVSDGNFVPAAGQPVALIYREIVCIDGFMKLVYAENPGAAWGFMRSASPNVRQVFFSVISGCAAIAMIWAIFSGWMGTALGTWALGSVLGGALGNLVDRALYQVVVDFILNYIGEYRWPVYNVADIGISVGVGLILLELFLQRGQPARSARSERAAESAESAESAEKKPAETA